MVDRTAQSRKGSRAKCHQESKCHTSGRPHLIPIVQFALNQRMSSEPSDPVIIIVDDPRLQNDGRGPKPKSHRARIGDEISVSPYTKENLAVVVHNKLAVAKVAQERSHWIGGRIANAFSGNRGDYIELLGVHLTQIFPHTGFDLPDFVQSNGAYLLRTDMAELALDNLKAELGQETA